MKLSFRDYLLVVLFLALLVTAALWGIQRHRSDLLAAEKARGLSLQEQDSVIKKYIPAKLEVKNSDELAGMGINLWKE